MMGIAWDYFKLISDQYYKVLFMGGLRVFTPSH